MNITRRNFLIGGAATLGALGFYACTKKTNTKNLRCALAYSSDNFSPVANKETLSIVTNSYVYEGLYNLDHKTNRIYNGLAALDPIKIDSNHYEIVLKDNLRFSNGEALTAQDCVNSFSSFKKDGVFKYMLEPLYDINIKDNKTLIVSTIYDCGKILKDILAVFCVYSKDNLGSGPYAYQNIDSSKIEFCPNTYYEGKFPPVYEHMTFHIEKSDTERAKMLISDNVDVIENSQPDNIEKNGAKFESKESTSATYVRFNTNKHSLDIRQAILYSIDSQKIINECYFGKGSVADSVLPKTHEAYRRAKRTYTYNVIEAKKLVPPNYKIKLSIVDGFPKAFYGIIEDNLADVGFSIEYDDTNPDVEIIMGDTGMYTNNASIMMSYWYGAAYASLKMASF
ncbi:MAG: ABC transporter substrate-binding protein [Coriobacteriia bacterium]|nr:ABC transporter substrate-binding protein [Coriobacteriia bacterium]